MIKRVAIVGAGNVASHLAPALKGAGCLVTQVFSRTADKALDLAQSVEAKVADDLASISGVDLVLVAVSDDQTAEVCNALPAELLVAHTSGMTHLDDISRERKASFYPLQTLSKDNHVDFSNVPFCIEASNEGDCQLLEKLAGTLTKSVRRIESDQRQALHLAAVFASNFVNHLYGTSQQIVEDAGLDFAILKPLIQEVAAKIQDLSPSDAQTGPARRQDIDTLNRHLDMLLEDPPNHELYHVLTDRIMNKYHGQ